MDASRRTLFKALTAGAATASISGCASSGRTSEASPSDGCALRPDPAWGRGIEGQRKADLGDGRYLNPILSGDRPDPTILKDGDEWFMTFTSFTTYPGLTIWRSSDLINWAPIRPALHTNIGNVFAVDLIKHEGRYFIYIPAVMDGGPGFEIYVIWTEDIRAGQWSDPVKVGVNNCIDPGHIVGEDGKRYLFVNGIRYVRLSDDGLRAEGELLPAYDPWRYPEDWITENFAPEGPKLLRRNGWFYLVTAVGGTAGPVTGHMVIAARSRSVHGPWEHCPHNPQVRTLTESEPWWSRGHATLVEGPAADWWMVYHGYENGFRTLGRQTLLEPMEWTDDGWFRALGGDLSRPLAKPAGGRAGANGMALSDDFRAGRLGVQWAFHKPGPAEMERISFDGQGLRLACAGTTPADSSPLCVGVGERSYEAEVSLDLLDGGEGGILLFYNNKAFLGIGFDGAVLKSFNYSAESVWARQSVEARSVRVRVRNDRNVATFHYSLDEGRSWRRHDTRMEVSGFNHNTFGDFLALRPAIYACGSGAVRLRNFTFSAG